MPPFAVNIDFDRVSEFYDLYVNATFDLRFWINVARRAPAPRLELMCGTGRITLPILAAGLDVEGLDYSTALLTVFRRKLAVENLTTTLQLADARDFGLGRKYGLIFIGFHSIAEVVDDDDKLRVFRTVRRHLAADGVFWVSLHNPPQRRAALDGRLVDLGHYRVPLGDEQVHVTGCYELDAQTGIATGTQVYRCWRAGQITRCVELPMGFHLLTPERLDTLLATAGLTVVDRLGDYAGSAFDAATSPYYVACCRGA